MTTYTVNFSHSCDKSDSVLATFDNYADAKRYLTTVFFNHLNAGVKWHKYIINEDYAKLDAYEFSIYLYIVDAELPPVFWVVNVCDTFAAVLGIYNPNPKLIKMYQSDFDRALIGPFTSRIAAHLIANSYNED